MLEFPPERSILAFGEGVVAEVGEGAGEVAGKMDLQDVHRGGEAQDWGERDRGNRGEGAGEGGGGGEEMVTHGAGARIGDGGWLGAGVEKAW